MRHLRQDGHDQTPRTHVEWMCMSLRNLRFDRRRPACVSLSFGYQGQIIRSAECESAMGERLAVHRIVLATLDGWFVASTNLPLASHQA